MRLDILWEDPHGLAINKPAGLLTHAAARASDQPTLDAGVRSYLRPDDPGSVYLGTVHRLDRPVSGVILWAKTPKAARRWGEEFADRRTRKEYWAIVECPPGDLGPISSVWEDWLSRPDQVGRAHVVSAGTPGAVSALTEVERAEATSTALDRSLAWLILRPATGRTHQLRIQAAARGFPIVGDLTYGARTGLESGIALHARRLSINHPVQRTPLMIEAPLPAAWSQWNLER